MVRPDESRSNIIAGLRSDKRCHDLVSPVLALGRCTQRPNNPAATTRPVRCDRVFLLATAVFSVAISLAKPSRFGWRILKLDLIIENDSPLPSTPASITDIAATETDIFDNEKRPEQITNGQKTFFAPGTHTADNSSDLDNVVHPMSLETLRHVRKWLRIASICFVVNVVVTLILWHLPLYRDYIFTRSFFGGWVTVAIIWHFAAMGAVIVYPCYDCWESISTSVRGVTEDFGLFLRQERVKA
jgi:hypothetical protein